MAKIVNSQADPASPAVMAEGTSALIPNHKLLAMYEALIKSRLLQQRARDLFEQGKLESDLRASSGREASAVAVCIDLLSTDTLSIMAGDWLPACVKGFASEGLLHSLAP